MNKGIITKIVINEDKPYYNIRLDRNVKIGDIEYNIYIDEDKKRAYLFNVNHNIDIPLNGVVVVMNNKCDFKLKIKTKTEKDKYTVVSVKIEEISYGE